MLRVQVAVPEDEMDGSNSGKFVFDSIRTALKVALPRFTRHKVPFTIADHLSLIDEVEKVWRTQVKTAAP